MTHMPRVDAAMTADWPDLVDELDRWGAAGRVARLWWRDDDAVDASCALGNLLRLAGPAPLALAVIPSRARPGLAANLAAAPAVAVLQHGWRHANRAAHGKKTEYPAERPAAAVAAELAAGRDRLAELFGGRALPVFVPPWNRFAPELLPLLPESGLVALSGMAALPPRAPPPAGVAALDVHVDVTDWRGNRGFVGAGAAIGGLVFWLQAARLGAPATPGPIGVLSHHIVMDRATAAFLDRLGALVADHSAARWIDIAGLVR